MTGAPLPGGDGGSRSSDSEDDEEMAALFRAEGSARVGQPEEVLCVLMMELVLFSILVFVLPTSGCARSDSASVDGFSTCIPDPGLLENAPVGSRLMQ